MHTNLLRGIETLIFLRLFSDAPIIFITLVLLVFLFSGKGINILPERYLPVRELGLLATSSYVPFAIISPPCLPALGPISIRISAARIISGSCSTTSTVLPISLKFFNSVMSLLLSLGCKPILGSSRTYKVPTSEEPNEVARFMRCVSPPERVLLNLSKVRYPMPTLFRKVNLLIISLRIRSATRVSYSVNSSPIKNGSECEIGSFTISYMEFPFILTCNASLLNRVPLQAVQVVYPRYLLSRTLICSL